MREYRQLTEEDRIEIYAMKQAGKKQNEIAFRLGVNVCKNFLILKVIFIKK
jgi:IS30 family transposase